MFIYLIFNTLYNLDFKCHSKWLTYFLLKVYNFITLDSGVGAGIDSYYEYCLKAYILLGDNVYLERFNKVRL